MKPAFLILVNLLLFKINSILYDFIFFIVLILSKEKQKWFIIPFEPLVPWLSNTKYLNSHKKAY